jgi:hypothetical protein
MAHLYVPVSSGVSAMVQRANAADIQIDSDDDILKYKDGDDAVRKVGTLFTELVTGATRAIVAADNGKILLANAATDINFTLPATALHFRVTIGILTPAGSGKLHTITPVAGDKIQGTNAAGTALDGADGIALNHTQATAKQGDFVTLVADGAAGYVVLGTQGVWVKAS